MMMGAGGWLVGLVVLLVFLLFVGGAIALIAWLVTQGSRSARAEPEPMGEDEALKILRLRYARGEISRDEFERIREEIRT